MKIRKLKFGLGSLLFGAVVITLICCVEPVLKSNTWIVYTLLYADASIIILIMLSTVTLSEPGICVKFSYLLLLLTYKLYFIYWLDVSQIGPTI